MGVEGQGPQGEGAGQWVGELDERAGGWDRVPHGDFERWSSGSWRRSRSGLHDWKEKALNAFTADFFKSACG